MIVEKVNSVNYSASKNSARVVPFRAKVNWSKIEQTLSKDQGRVAKALSYLGQNDGEILNTLVTAFGTAVIAPIFIAGNPLSKEDNETKWYSAMRQPISAVIAMIMQLGVNKAFNNYMAKQASTGGFGPLADLRALPKDSYLKRIVELEHPEYTKEQVKAEVTRKRLQAEREVVALTRRDLQGQVINIEDIICEDTRSKARKQLEDSLMPELEGKSKKEIKKILKERITPEMVEERACENMRISIEKEAQAKYQIRQLKKEGLTVEQAIERYNGKKPSTKFEQDVVKDVLERLHTIKEYEQASKMKDFESVKHLGDTLEKVKHNVKAKRLVKTRTSDAAKRFSKYNKWCGIFVSLATLPISCGLLNWAYPRVMEVVMPKLQPWIHRNNPDWSPEKAKKYGPPPKVEKATAKAKEVKNA